uniref:Uncharacterized protein n=1 Tax=viral metagenome TaxID=1070528 RepID=A0A6C0J8Y5_9ZZZZ
MYNNLKNTNLYSLNSLNNIYSPNIYLTLTIIGITILTVKLIYPKEKEHFGNPLSLLKSIGEGIVNFALNFIDILLVIADVFSLIGILPFIFMDIIMILITWFHPLVMIKGVVNSIFIFAKILFLALFDVIVQILRIFFHKVFGLLKGGLWGIPHGPDQHWRHDQIASGVKDSFGDHHHGPHKGASGKKNKDQLYRPLRCYKSVGSEGYINMIATIICPPLGVFMAFGLSGWLKIIVCCILSLMYYVPGLVYALLITTHLGLGRHITAKDCGGIANYGLRIAGCTGIKNKLDCENAKIPGWRDKNGDAIRACGYVTDTSNLRGGQCFNIIYPNAIHTTGSRNRDAGEVGGVGGTTLGDREIDHGRELAKDKQVGSRGKEYDPKNDPADNDLGINYDPLMLAKESGFDKELGDDSIDIPDGPWKFVGGD